ncbi:MAG: 16S rRNA (uracil(1498)-N(3))-methyltransferase [Bacilli bacterium]|jgi:16S rRNA (uracil1498-N3)-methyltransferase|nr:16S rRNA (uracil(1498)-N(3))-methyltransferase [Acholeplasmataceae bacterium]
MQRYFLKNEAIKGKKALIRGGDHHHIRNVMRMRSGDKVSLCDEDGNAFLAEIAEIRTEETLLNILEKIESESELGAAVTIAMGLVRREKQEEVLRRITELGAAGFLTVSMERSVVKAREKSAHLERQKRIAKEAAEQSQRRRIPNVYGNLSFEEFLDFSDQFEIRIFAYEERAHEKDAAFKRLIRASLGKEVLVLVGPEGGISPGEADALKERGFVSVGLGPRILRVETAPLYIMSAFGYELELEDES